MPERLVVVEPAPPWFPKSFPCASSLVVSATGGCLIASDRLPPGRFFLLLFELFLLLQLLGTVPLGPLLVVVRLNPMLPPEI